MYDPSALVLRNGRPGSMPIPACLLSRSAPAFARGPPRLVLRRGPLCCNP